MTDVLIRSYEDTETLFSLQEQYEPGEWETMDGPVEEEGLLRAPGPNERIIRVERRMVVTEWEIP